MVYIEPVKVICINLLTKEKIEIEYDYSWPDEGYTTKEHPSWLLHKVTMYSKHVKKFFKNPVPCLLSGTKRDGLFIIEKYGEQEGQSNLLITEKTPLEMAEIIDQWGKDRW